MLKIGGDETQVLEVQVEGSKKVYRIPLAPSLPMGQIMKVRRINRIKDEDERAAAQVDFFYELACKYIPEAVIGELSQAAFNTLTEAWLDASNEAGADMGESGASPTS